MRRATKIAVLLAILSVAAVYSADKERGAAIDGQIARIGRAIATLCTNACSVAGLRQGGAAAIILPTTSADSFSNLLVSSISVSPTNVALGMSWSALTTSQDVLDVYSKTNLTEAAWSHLAEVDVDVLDEAVLAAIPLEWLGYPPSAFFRLGTRLDSDGDGLPDSFERLASRTDPKEPDSDGDGMNDGWEMAHAALGYDPLAADTNGLLAASADFDGDGLSNYDEQMIGSDPANADTDGDGVADGAEIPQASILSIATQIGLPLLMLGQLPGSWFTIPELNFCSDPCGGDTSEYVPFGLLFGDPSTSHSEKYSLAISPVPGSGFGAPPQTISLLNGRYGVCDVALVFLKKGWHYTVRLTHRATNLQEGRDPDYALIGAAASRRVFLVDDDGLFGVSSVTNGSFAAEGKVADIYVLDDPSLAPDYDRDGQIDSVEQARAKQGSAFRFWINDDEDGSNENGNYATSTTSDIPGSSTPDFDDSTVNGRCDLIDFTPVFIDAGCLSVLPQSIKSELVFKLRQGDGAANVVWSSVGRGNVGSFQISDSATCGPLLDTPPRNAATSQITSGGIETPQMFANMLVSPTTQGGVFFIEGRAASTAPLCLDVEYDNEVVATAELPLSLSSVEDMFWSYSLRGSEGGGNFTLPATYTPTNVMDELGDNTVFFLHGFNVTTETARGWGSEMFKRLWQSGSNARFSAVTWCGDFSWTGNWANGVHYHRDVFNAMQSAGALKSLVEREQPSSSNRMLMAHSLGNMVVCEALRQGLEARKYFLFDAAIASEAIDGSFQDANAVVRAKYVPSDWADYPTNSWASNWHRWFQGNPSDARGEMGWPDYFRDALTNAVSIYNYYSTGDPVFIENATVPDVVSGVFHWPTLQWSWPPINWNITMELHCWQKQESHKGVEPVAGTLGGGWGFHLWIANDGSGDHAVHYSATDANAMIADGSITNNPIFSTSGTPLTNPNATQDDIWRALAKYIPAISSPVGGSEALNQNNVNLNDSSEVGRPNGWGRDHNVYEASWLHSDIKDMAFFYVYKLYEQLVTRGEMQ